MNVTCLDWPFKKKTNMCANLKQVLSWEIKKIDLLKLWIYGTAFDLCVTGRAGIYVWDAGPVWGRPDSVRWAGCFVHTVHPLLCCRKYVLHLCYICITYNSSGVIYCKPTFILCKKFLRSWQKPHCREYFSPQTSIWQIHVLVCGEKYSLFFSKNCFLTA